MRDYDPADDSKKCYDLAIKVKRERGDTHWPQRDPWQRKEVIGGCTLYLGDCSDIVPVLGKIDGLVADGPYKFETSGGGKLRSRRPNMDQIAAAGLDQGFDHTIFTGRQFGSAVFFAHNDQWAELLPYLASEFDRYAIVPWIKTNALPVANRHYRPDTEIYVHAWNSGFHPVGDLQQKKRFIIAKNGQDPDIDHPTVKPQAVMSKIICNVAGQTVLDPFMGSGSTGVACVKAGRNFIGIERHEPYFEIACDRIRKAYAQSDLLVSSEPVTAVPRQEGFL